MYFQEGDDLLSCLVEALDVGDHELTLLSKGCCKKVFLVESSKQGIEKEDVCGKRNWKFVGVFERREGRLTYLFKLREGER